MTHQIPNLEAAITSSMFTAEPPLVLGLANVEGLDSTQTRRR